MLDATASNFLPICLYALDAVVTVIIVNMTLTRFYI